MRVVQIQIPNVLKMMLAKNGIQISQGSTGELIPPLKRTNEISDVVHINKKQFDIVVNFNGVLNKNTQPIIRTAVPNKRIELIL